MYPTNQGSNIGTLLRMIREDQSKSIAATPPAAEPGSPIREVVQQPLSSPEDPGSARVVSVRPEAATQSGEVVAPVSPSAPAVTPAASPVVAPIAPVAPTPSAPSFSPSQPSRGAPAPRPSVSAAPAPSLPNIGTTIRAAAPRPVSNTFTPAPGVKYFTPQRSSLRQIISNPFGGNRPTPTPAPQQKSTNGIKGILGGWLS